MSLTIRHVNYQLQVYSFKVVVCCLFYFVFSVVGFLWVGVFFCFLFFLNNGNKNNVNSLL